MVSYTKVGYGIRALTLIHGNLVDAKLNNVVVGMYRQYNKHGFHFYVPLLKIVIVTPRTRPKAASVKDVSKHII